MFDEATKIEIERLRRIQFLKPLSEPPNEEHVLFLIREYEKLILAPEPRPVVFHPISTKADLQALSIYDHDTSYRKRYDEEVWQPIYGDGRKVAFMSNGRMAAYLNKLIDATMRNTKEYLLRKDIPKGVESAKLFTLLTANTSAYISNMLYPAGPNPLAPLIQLLEEGLLCVSTKEKWIVVYQVAEGASIVPNEPVQIVVQLVPELDQTIEKVVEVVPSVAEPPPQPVIPQVDTKI